MKKDSAPTENIIHSSNYSGSRKIFVSGKLHNIKVAMREVSVSPTLTRSFGINFGPGAFEVNIAYNRRTTVSGAGYVKHIKVIFFDCPV